MSTILKALRRLEQEKQAGGDRPLREEVVSSAPVEPDPPGSRRRMFAVLGALWVVTVAVLVFTQWSAFDRQLAELRDVAAAPDVEAQTPAPAAEESAVAMPRREVREPAPAPPPRAVAEDPDALPDDAFASQVEVVKRPAVSPRRPIEIARASDPMPEPDAEPAVAPTPPAPKPAPVAKAPAPEPAPAEPVRVAKTARPPPAPAPKAAPVAKAPPVPSPPPAPAASGLAVEKTLWHPSVSRRAAFVALGGEPATRVEEGDTVGRYSVLEIKPTGVVFLRDGRELTLQVGAK